jgi:hypothetical protein
MLPAPKPFHSHDRDAFMRYAWTVLISDHSFRENCITSLQATFNSLPSIQQMNTPSIGQQLAPFCIEHEILVLGIPSLLV